MSKAYKVSPKSVKSLMDNGYSVIESNEGFNWVEGGREGKFWATEDEAWDDAQEDDLMISWEIYND